MGENPVARFRRVFADRLRSGKYDPIDVVQAVKALSTGELVVAGLDVYCSLFDPSKAQTSRSSFELGRVTGFNLFVQALEMARPQNHLAEMVRSFADGQSALLRDDRLAKRVAVYRPRYAALDPKDQQDLQGRAEKILDNRAVEASKKRYLLDDLAKAFQNQHGRPPKDGDLAWFDPGPATARKEFERLATACEAAWFPKGQRIAGQFVMTQFVPTPGVKPPVQKSSVVATRNVNAAFAAFAAFVKAQINQPLDLFRLLAWASEPANPYLELRVRHARNVPVASRAWSGVWRELYQDIAIRGLYVAVNRWRVYEIVQARAYVGKDLRFVLAPLDAHWRELLRRRLTSSVKAPKEFTDAQDGRRRAKVWGDVKGLEIVDELQSESHLKDLIKQFEEDPKAVLARKVRIVSARAAFQTRFSLFETVPGVFTVVWIPKGTGTRVAYVEVHAIPGVVFKAWGDRVGLEELLEDKAYSDLAANAAALTEFLLFYLQVLGYVLDVITAGASGGVRVVLLRFVEERIKDKIIAEGLEIAGIDNPWVQTLAGFAGGFVPSAIKAPKVGAVKGLDELDREAQTVTRGGAPVKRRTGDGAGGAAPPAPPPVAAPAAGVRGSGEMIGDSLFVVEKASASDVAAQAAKVAKETPKVPGPLDRAKDYLVDVGDRATERLVKRVPSPAGGLFATRLPTSGAAPGRGGPSGAGSRATARASRAAERLRKSSDYKMLIEYENQIMASWEKVESQKARVAIVNALERSGGGTAAEREAFGQLRAALNKAKGDAGEFALTADLHTLFDVADIVTIPTRGNGPPVLDVVVRLRRNSKQNRGKRFALGEAKGGLNTSLGEVTPKRYYFAEGKLGFRDVRRPPIRQASGEWYYQKFAELYVMGQRIGGVEGKKMQGLANELFDAARNGEVAAVVGKSNVKLDRKLFDSSAEVASFFTSRRWDSSRGFPIEK